MECLTAKSIEIPEEGVRTALHEAAAQAQRDAASIPEGMRMLPEEERLQTLDVLAQSKTDTEAKLRVNRPQSHLSVQFLQACMHAACEFCSLLVRWLLSSVSKVLRCGELEIESL